MGHHGPLFSHGKKHFLPSIKVLSHLPLRLRGRTAESAPFPSRWKLVYLKPSSEESAQKTTPKSVEDDAMNWKVPEPQKRAYLTNAPNPTCAASFHNT